MKICRLLIISFFIYGFIFTGFTQDKSFIISGYVQDASSGERLPGAGIYCAETARGTQTNTYGFFSISLSEMNRNIEVSYIGFTAKKIEIAAVKDTFIVVSLNKKQFEIDEVLVSADKTLQSVQRIGKHQLTSSQIEKIPIVLGETDILKAYQMLPGVQTGIQGTSGMVVRGSDPGQNLILLDGVPVYNASHLFGLFSVFNSDAINSSTLIKGAFPARYGGRVSSVMDIRMKEGNNQKLKGVASVGLISAKFLLEGPLIKGKTSFMLSARTTYIDLFTSLYQKLLYGNTALFSYNFHDLNLKVNHKITDHNRLYFSMYYGKDVYNNTMKFDDETDSIQTEHDNGFNWGNLTATLRWNFQPGKRLFFNTTLIYSRYAFETHTMTKTTYAADTTGKSSVFELGFNSGIEDYGAKVDVDYWPGKNHRVQFGALYTHHRFKPGVNIVDFTDFGNLLKADTIDHQEELYNNEAALYLEDEWSISPEFMVQAGIRGTSFFTDTKTYYSIEPRLFLKYTLNSNNWFGMAYSRTSQNIHLLTNSSVGFPTDQWVPVTDSVKPILANQYNISYNLNFDPGYSFSVEGFYKDMQNVVEYQENANLKNNWQEIIEQGEGKAYGIELLLKKESGKLTGWLAYTLSKSDRIFKDINNGIVFPYKYDRRHDFKIVMMYPLSEKIDIGVNWVFTTGHAVTLPLERIYNATSLDRLFYGYYYTPEVYTYDTKNNFRMPDYHRLDITVNFSRKLGRFDRTLSLGVYNVYAHHNALYYDFFEGKLRSISYLSVLPSINYVLRF
ncbi:MAG: TonB-dependent receptor [Prolixibacteraceae bacterium]|nr:TonB-dependent receptor [Prolixibacteraceae bacterium]